MTWEMCFTLSRAHKNRFTYEFHPQHWATCSYCAVLRVYPDVQNVLQPLRPENILCEAAVMCLCRFQWTSAAFPLQDEAVATPQLKPLLFPSSLSLSLGPCSRQARENAVLFLEGTATCRPKGGMEPEWVVISAITCAHVTGLAQGSCGVNHRRPRIIAAFPFQLQKA